MNTDEISSYYIMGREPLSQFGGNFTQMNQVKCA